MTTKANEQINVDQAEMSMQQLQEQIVADICADKSLLGQDGLLTHLLNAPEKPLLKAKWNHTSRNSPP